MDSVTFFAPDHVTHAVGHRPNMGEEAKVHEMKKAPRHLGPPESSISILARRDHCTDVW